MNRFLAAIAAAACSCALAGPIQLVKDINRTIAASGTAGKPVAFGSKWLATLCAVSDPSQNSYSTSYACAPFATDGTADGTVALASVRRPSGDNVGPYAVSGSTAYFLEGDPATSTLTLWKTDGTAAGTTSVTSLPSAYYGYANPGAAIAATPSLVFFSTSFGDLWRSDGTSTGTFRLAMSISSFAVVGSTVYFGAKNDAATGNELYQSDGTLAGTVLLKDINAGVSSSTPTGLKAIGGKVYFWATDTDFAPPMLWVTDGTAAGTQQVMDIAPNTRSAFVEYAGKAYFLALGNSNINGLWSTDGTNAGTTLVSAWTAFTSDYNDLTVSGGYLYYTENYSVYRTDGTMAGTVKVNGGPSYGLSSFVSTGNDLYFVGTANTGTSSLWTIAAGGTNATQVIVTNATLWGALGSKLLLSSPTLATLYDATNGMQAMQTASGEPSSTSRCGTSIAVLGSRAFFPANDGVHGCELWMSDGTDAGTAMVKDFSTGLERGATIGPITAAGAFVYFVAQTPASTTEVWRTDGTSAGTMLVQSVSAYYGGTPMAAAGSSVAFLSNAGLYYVDPVSGTASLVASQTSSAGISGPYAASDGFFYSTSNSTTYPSVTHLYKYNASSGTSVDLGANAPPPSYYSTGPTALSLGNVLVWGGTTSTTVSLWRSDGTAAGTYALYSASSYYYPSFSTLGSSSGRAYFTINGAVYRTDGTTATGVSSSSPYNDIYAVGPSGLWYSDSYGALQRIAPSAMFATQIVPSGISYYSPTFVFATSSGAYFARADNTTGSELWISAGAASATALLQDLEPGPTSASFSTAPVAELPSGVLLFANHAGTGMEPYFIANDTTPDPIAFASQSGVALNATITSAPVAVQGLTQPATISAMNGQFCVSSTSSCACDVQPFNTSGSVNFNQYLCARHTSALTPGTSTTTLLNVGGVTASFTSTTIPGRSLTVATSGAGSGNVVSAPTGISCGADCSEIYVQGTSVRLVASANPGARFTGWSGGGCSGVADCVVALNADTTVTANFDATPIARLPHDFNYDGRSDLVWRGPGGTFGAWIMNGTGSTSYATLSGGTGFSLVQVGDFDGDGRGDLLWRGTDGTYKVQLMNGTTVVAENVILNGGTGWEVIGKGDFDGDGKTDLLWKAANGTYGLWLMNGSTYSSAGLFQAPGIGWDVVLVADFDGDGKTDILWRNTDGRVDMWLMNGFLSTAQTSMIGSATGWVPTHAADFNGDGKMDLLWRNSDGSLGLWLVNGTQITQYTQLLGANSGWTVSGVGDMDGDGKADVILTHTNGSVGGWIMNGATIASYGSLRGAGSGWSVVTTGDFNGDGRTDIVWKNTDGSVAVWLMDGLAPLGTSTILGAGSGWSVMP